MTPENPWLETVTFGRRTGRTILLVVGIYEKLFCIIVWELIGCPVAKTKIHL